MFDCKLTQDHHHELTVKPFLYPDCPVPQTARAHYDCQVPHRWQGHRRVSVHHIEEHSIHPHVEDIDCQIDHLNFIRLVQMSGGQKKDTTSLEMAVSVVIAPHQIFVRRACNKSLLTVCKVHHVVMKLGRL